MADKHAGPSDFSSEANGLNGTLLYVELLRRLKILKKLDKAPDDILDGKAVLRALAVTFSKENPIATLKI